MTDNLQKVRVSPWWFFGAGLSTSILVLIRGRHRKFLWILPVILLLTGALLLLQQRQSRIVKVQQSILGELDTLDPVARAQVIKAIAEKEVSRYRIPDN